MISKFKQLYNAISYSETYNLKDGTVQKDAKKAKFDKNKFTPHNLRTLLIGNDRAVAIHYVSYSGKPIVQEIKFKTGLEGLQHDEDKYKKWVQSNIDGKPLIEVLHHNYGVKFNFVEEIYFFTGGFYPDELKKETEGIVKFFNNSDVKKSLIRLTAFHRLEGAVITDTMVASLKQYCHDNPRYNMSLLNFFKKFNEKLVNQGYPQLSSTPKNYFEVKTNELGL